MLNNLFETVKEFGESLLDIDPGLPRPDASGPVEDIREYDKKTAVIVDDVFLTEVYGLDLPEVASAEIMSPELELPEAPRLAAVETDNSMSIEAARAATARALAQKAAPESSYDFPKAA